MKVIKIASLLFLAAQLVTPSYAKDTSSSSKTKQETNQEGKKTSNKNNNKQDEKQIAKKNEKNNAKKENKTASSSNRNSKITSWNISGSMAARRGRNGWNAGINWRQQGQGSYQIRLIGPAGGGTVVLTKSGGGVTYQEGAKKIACNNPSQLLQKETGISLPINNLYYWVRGISAPGSVEMERRDQNNRLTILKQNGYTIRYNYASNDLPTKVSLNGNGASIKLVIRNW